MLFMVLSHFSLKILSWNFFKRDDSVEPLKSYTDPSFFFNNWRKKVSKANEQLKAEKRPKVSQ